MTSPVFEIVSPGAATAHLAWAVVDSTDDDLVWGVATPVAGSIAAVRFHYEAWHPEPRYLYYIGADFAFAEAGTHSWYPCRPGARARGEVEYETPPGWTVVATGVRRGSSHDASRGYFTAAFPSELWFAAGPLRSFRLDGPIPVTVYGASADIHAGDVARRASRTLDALRRRFGRFPYPGLSVIEVPTPVATKAGGFNGVAASGAIAFETSFLRAFELAHVAHELGHEWWGQSLSRRDGSVGGDYMLDEAMTEYGALEVVEALDGPAAGEEYRRHDVPRPTGGGNYGAVEYLKLAAAGYDTALCCLPDRPTSYRLARSKGARAWYAISQSLGRDRFDAALSLIAARRAYTTVTWDEVLADLERELGPDARRLCHEWFDREGAPRWDVSWTLQRGRLTVAIAQSPPTYHVNVELAITTVNGTRSRRIALTDAVTNYTSAEADSVIGVQVDPHFRVLHQTPEYAAEATALVPDTRARLLLQAGRKAEAESLLVHALPAVNAPDVYGAEFLIASTLARFAEDRNDWQTAASLAERALAAPVRRPDVLPFTYLRLARVSARIERWERAAAAARAALVAHAASGSRAGITQECERLLAQARAHGAH